MFLSLKRKITFTLSTLRIPDSIDPCFKETAMKQKRKIGEEKHIFLSSSYYFFNRKLFYHCLWHFVDSWFSVSFISFTIHSFWLALLTLLLYLPEISFFLFLLNFFPLSVFQVLTKDSVTVSVDAVVYYRVSNATVSIANVENAHHSTRLLAQTTLRNTMGTQHLHEILSERMTISDTMQVSE